MNLSEKLGAFKANLSLNASVISGDDLASIRISNARNLKNILFEDAVVLSSAFIGKNSFIGANSYMNDGGCVRSGVFIGRYCSIGRRVTLGAGSHFMLGLSTSPAVRAGTANPYTREQVVSLGGATRKSPYTIIGSDVWIGDGVVVIPGVTIGVGAVIGANSVVTRDVPPYAVAGGVPARVIKYRFPEEIIPNLLSTEWWERPTEKLQELPTGNIFEFIDAIEKEQARDVHRFGTYTLEFQS